MILTTPTNRFDNEVSTRDTVLLMTQIAKRQCSLSLILSVVDQLQVRYMNPVAAVRTIWGWVQNNIQFKEDEVQLIQDNQDLDSELLRTPEYILTVDRQGDCDDFSLLTATLLLAGTDLGVSFCTIKMTDDRPDDWSHIYVVATTNKGEVIPMDASHGPYCGWEMPDHYVGFKRYWVVRKPKEREEMGANCVLTSGHPGDAMGMGNAPLQGVGLEGGGGFEGVGLESIYLPGRGMGSAGTPDPSAWTTILQTAIQSGIQTISNIAQARYAVPPAGTAITAPGHSVVRVEPGATVNPSLNIGGGISSGTLLLLGGGLLLVMMMSKR